MKPLFWRHVRRSSRYFISTPLLWLAPALPAGAQTLPAPAPAPASVAPAPERASLSGRASLSDARNAASASAELLTLEDALTLALQNNPRRRTARAELIAALGRAGAARSERGPQVSFTNSQTLNRTYGTPAMAAAGGAGAGAGAGGGTGTGTGGGTGAATRTSRLTAPGNSNGGAAGGASGGGAAGAGGLGTEDIQFGQQFGLDLTVPIFSGGRLSAQQRQARAEAFANAANLRQIEGDIALDTTSAYLGVLRSSQLLAVSESNISVSRERGRVARVLVISGLASRLETLRANTQLAQAVQNRLAASNTLGEGRAALNSLIGRAPETPLNLERVTSLALRLPLPEPLTAPVPELLPIVASNGAILPKGAASNRAPAPKAARGTENGGFPPAPRPKSPQAGATNSLGEEVPRTSRDDAGFRAAKTQAETNSQIAGATNFAANVLDDTTAVGVDENSSARLRAIAEAIRPSLAANRARVTAAQANVGVAQSGRRPTLDFNISNLLRSPATFLGRFVVSLGVAGAGTLFSSGRVASQVSEAKALVESESGRLQGERTDVAERIERALLQLDTARERLVTADDAVIEAGEAVRVSSVGFRVGLNTGLDITDAQNSLLEAQTEAVNARFDFAGAQARLASEVGTFSGVGLVALERALIAEDAASAAREVTVKEAAKRRKSERRRRDDVLRARRMGVTLP